MKDKEVMPAAELQKQKLYAADVAAIMQVRAMGTEPKAFVRTYGCQQNVADGEKIKGMLAEMGFAFTDDENEADFILFNTCAIREHAEDRVYGNIGALKNVKRRNPSVLIAVCGCMMEQAHVAERIRTTFPFVNIVFGTHVIHRLPEMIFTAVTDSKRVFLRGEESKEIVEGLPVRRDGTARAWVTVMYGCDNFCSYCVVPYVRGREKSRHPDAIVEECRGLIEQGYKEITLLGQNVNSYGKGLEEKINFSELLRRIDAIDGDYRLRFMTSHPKDATRELFDTIAEPAHLPSHPPAVSIRQQPRFKGNEPPLRPREVPRPDCLRKGEDARPVLDLGHYRRLPGRDLRGISGYAEPHPRSGVHLAFHVHLLLKTRHEGRVDGGSGAV